MKQSLLAGVVAEAQDAQPPISLNKFRVQMGISRQAAWRLRKQGALKTVNLYGRLYVTSRAAADFNRRLEAGEFAKQIQPPKRDEAKPLKANRQRRLAA